MKILALGGCGQEGSVAVRDLVEQADVTLVTIADIDLDRASAFAAELGAKAKALHLDVLDRAALVAAMRAHDVTASFVGPYYLLGRPIVEAAIEAKTPLLDINDDYDASEDVLSLDGEARVAGVTIVIGAGASPGLFNLVAKHSADRMASVDSIDIRWCVSISDFEGHGTSAAVPHLMHMIDGDIPQFLDGEFKAVEGLSGAETIDFHAIGAIEVYYVGHAEPVTLPRYIPGLRRVTNKGSIPGANELLRAFRDIGLTSRQPIDVNGMQVNPRDFAAALIERLPNDDPPPAFSSGQVVVSGRDEVGPLTIVSDFIEPRRMSPVTGLSAAVGVLMLGRGQCKVHGVFAPEGALDPETFIAGTEQRGIRFRESMVRPD